MSLKDKLALYRNHLVTDHPPTTNVVEPREPIAACDEIPYAAAWASLSAHAYSDGAEPVMVREVRYPAHTWHGRYPMSALRDAVSAWEQVDFDHPLRTVSGDPESLLFFDTETTGLSGGTGNVIFLLGHSRLQGDEIVVHQHFLSHPAAEAALFSSFLQHVSASDCLVTFNGKSFDWPQVRTRHTLLRGRVTPLVAPAHLDLLHSARRIWRDELETCRLSLIEREKLHVLRMDDVPGSMAPTLYFQYLQSLNPEVVHGVLLHNEWDVLSLITLYVHLSRLLQETPATSTASPQEQFQIALWFEKLGCFAHAKQWYEIAMMHDHPVRTRAKVALGHIYKRTKEYGHAIAVWESSLRETRYDSAEVCLALSKVFEHHVKDYEIALSYALRAFAAAQSAHRLLRTRMSQDHLLQHAARIERLEHKLSSR